MSAKQDRTYPRTATDIERKYNFGKSFSEIMGLATDAQDAADRANDAADRAQSAVNDLNRNLDQMEIFNRLTNNGKASGLFIDPETGEIYINAAYIAAGILSSIDGLIQIDLNGGNMPVFNTGISTNGLVVRGDEAGAKKLVEIEAFQNALDKPFRARFAFNSASGANLVSFNEATVQSGGTEEHDGSSSVFQDQDGKQRVTIRANGVGCEIGFDFNGLSVGRVWGREDGLRMSGITGINGKTISWKDNGDGTYSLVGTD